MLQRNSLGGGLKGRKGNRKKELDGSGRMTSWLTTRPVTAAVLFAVTALFLLLSHHAFMVPTRNVETSVVGGIRNPASKGRMETEKQLQQQPHRQEGDTVQQDEDTAGDKIQHRDVLVLDTEWGSLRIWLRPDLSSESVAYIQEVVRTDACHTCRFHRAEKMGLLQGVMTSKSVPLPTVKGSCPEEYSKGKKKKCHGPIMERGMVGWAAGELGPDFFIDAYKQPAEWWGTEHTGA